MSEEIESDSKLKSRKFLVWVVWLVITIAVILFCVVAMVTTQTMSEPLTGLIEKVLGWFFAVSMMYLGMNVGQKAAYAISDALARPEDHA